MKMTRFNTSRDAWGTDDFKQALKSEVENIESGILPLQQAVTPGSYVDDNHLTCTILRVADDEKSIQAKVGVFFTEIVVSCGCGDEPMHLNAYTEMEISIDKTSAAVVFRVIPA